ncbi:MAG: peptidylprolyl isomerase [Candidatus Marinimicrobia bacterium]|nr:peptidylprolyl isomerase [Candidatus Neomarinimicrobiota bacterium]
MKQISKITIALLIFLSFAISQQLVDGIAAIVGEKTILNSEVQQMTYQLAQQQEINLANNQSQYEKIYNQALREIINMHIVELQAEVDSVYVKERDVNMTVQQQIDQYIAQIGSEEKLVEYFQMPLEKIKSTLFDRVESQMVVQKMQQNKFQDISVTRPEVVQYYYANKDSLPQIPERVDISHILIKPKPSKVNSEKTRSRLLEIRNQILNDSISFADAARKYSEDPGSAQNGGTFGFVPKGTFVKAFEKTAFALEKDEVSDIVETEFGLHIIKLIEKRGENINVAHILLSIKAGEADNQSTINKLSTLKDSLGQGADFASIAIKHSEDTDVEINQGHLGEFPIETFQIESFKTIVKDMSVDEVSDPFQSEYGFHIIKLNNRKPIETIKLNTHYGILQNMLTNEKRVTAWDEWLNSLYSEFYVDIK